MLAAIFGGQSPTWAAPETVILETRDGVQLRLTYFPSSVRAGSPEAKQTTPVILLHDHKETRSIFNPLAQKLAATGDGREKGPAFAAVTMDLRGHGESVKQLAPNGAQLDLDAARLTKPQLLAMAAYDMEAIRSFLVERNDAGELNLNKLCIVGAGMGANVAVNWAYQDWSAPPLAIGKQGQDVKAMVLISPQWSYNGLSFQAPMKFRALKQNVAWMILFGSQDAGLRADAERIEKQLARFHPAPAAGSGKRTGTLQVEGVGTKLQGSTLLKRGEIDPKIVAFLVEHAGKVQQPWISRLNRVPR